MLTDTALADAVGAAAQRHGIPGVAAAVERGEEFRSAAYGTLNVRSNVAVTDDSIFQIGSITKVFTGTLVMQLVDAGAVELDAPVRRYLPDVRIADAPISEAITVRSLLAHTSGIVGDFFIDTGRNPDALERYVRRCSELRYLTAPGPFSYCNSGYGILGRLIEVLGGASWVDQLRAKILEPLEIPALVDPEQGMLYRTAAGHVLTETGATVLTPTPYLPRSTEAAGSWLSMSPASLLRFAQMHLADGRAASGARVLSERSARAMRELQVRPPVAFYRIAGYGLAWAIRDPDAGVVGHNGGTIGQSAFLLLFPRAGLAVAVLTNITSATAGAAFEEILRAVADSVDGIAIAPEAAPDATVAVDRPALVGTYETAMNVIAVHAAGDELRATVSHRYDDGIAPLPDQHFALAPLDPYAFAAIDERNGGRSTVGFTSVVDGTPRYLFWGGRLAERVAP